MDLLRSLSITILARPAEIISSMRQSDLCAILTFSGDAVKLSFSVWLNLIPRLSDSLRMALRMLRMPCSLTKHSSHAVLVN